MKSLLCKIFIISFLFITGCTNQLVTFHQKLITQSKHFMMDI